MDNIHITAIYHRISFTPRLERLRRRMKVLLVNAEIFLPTSLKLTLVALKRLRFHVFAHVHDHVLLPEGRVITQVTFERFSIDMKP